MSDYLDSNRGAIPPLADSANHSPQNLADTGTAESHNAKAFTADRMHMLSVGAAAVRVLFAPSPALSNVVPPTGGAIIPANTLFTFRSNAKARHIYVEAAAGGATPYEASVWQRES